MPNHRKIRRARMLLIRTGGNHCSYCGCVLTRPSHPSGLPRRPTDRTVDHVVPRSKGGGDRPDNTVLACLSCNQAKGDLMPDQWDKVRRIA